MATNMNAAPGVQRLLHHCGVRRVELQIGLETTPGEYVER